MKYILVILIMSTTGILYGQQSNMFSQSADEFGLINPAGLSIEEMRFKGNIINLYVRNQWWNFETTGAPKTQALTWLYNSPEQSHIGAALIADKIGETQQFGLHGRYAHTVAKGWKVGISTDFFSRRVYIENLDIYDDNDLVAIAANTRRWQFAVSGGTFYHRFNNKRALNWFAGLSFRHKFFINALEGEEKTPNETNIFAHGGFSLRGWWIGGRLRLSLKAPDALDIYARHYFPEEDDGPFFVGGILTSDGSNHTAGTQLGYEYKMKDSKRYLIFNLGFSKPLSRYIYGNNLIFDGRVTWAFDKN